MGAVTSAVSDAGAAAMAFVAADGSAGAGVLSASTGSSSGTSKVSTHSGWFAIPALSKSAASAIASVSTSACLNILCRDVKISALSFLSSVAAIGVFAATAHNGIRAGNASGKQAAAYGYAACILSDGTRKRRPSVVRFDQKHLFNFPTESVSGVKHDERQ